MKHHKDFKGAQKNNDVMLSTRTLSISKVRGEVKKEV